MMAITTSSSINVKARRRRIQTDSRKKNPRCASPRETNGPKVADVLGRCDVTQRTLSDPADTPRVRRRGPCCVDCDGLESGEDEAFRGPIEAGGPLIWEEPVSGKRQQAADRVEPQMPEYHE